MSKAEFRSRRTRIDLNLGSKSAANRKSSLLKCSERKRGLMVTVEIKYNQIQNERANNGENLPMSNGKVKDFILFILLIRDSREI